MVSRACYPSTRDAKEEQEFESSLNCRARMSPNKQTPRLTANLILLSSLLLSFSSEVRGQRGQDGDPEQAAGRQVDI